MEAMAFSKPVVSTAHAGIPELVDTILVPENDPKALADAIEAYMRDPELRNRDGKRNRQAVERLNSSENLDRLVALFESIK
jgi:glycosyltransferase involved in cell wall biosynthesis